MSWFRSARTAIAPHPMQYLDAVMCCIVAIAVDASFPGTFSVASELWEPPPVTFPKELQ